MCAEKKRAAPALSPKQEVSKTPSCPPHPSFARPDTPCTAIEIVSTHCCAGGTRVPSLMSRGMFNMRPLKGLMASTKSPRRFFRPVVRSLHVSKRLLTRQVGKWPQAQTASSTFQRLKGALYSSCAIESRVSRHICSHWAGSRSSVWGCERLRATKPGKAGRPVGLPVGW